MHLASAITHHQVRMVIFLVGNPGYSIHKRHGLVKIREAESLVYLAGIRSEFPAVKFLQKLAGFLPAQRSDTPFTGFACLLSQIGHGLIV